MFSLEAQKNAELHTVPLAPFEFSHKAKIALPALFKKQRSAYPKALLGSVL